MLTRIISGFIGVAALLAVILFMPEFATEVAVAVVAAVALFEFYSAVFGKDSGLIKKAPIVVSGYALGLAFMFASEEFIFPVAVVGVLVMLAMPVLFHKTVSFGDCAAAYIGSVYIFALLRHISMVRCLENGKFLVFAIFIGAFITDTGAYFAGNFFGKHKLAPELSPKKTIEGSVGGIAATVFGFCIFAYLGNRLYGYGINSGNVIIIAVILSIVSQIGDLAASVIKREMGIKDYGNIMPGHGGALDRFDSVLFVAPAFWYLNTFLPIFVI